MLPWGFTKPESWASTSRGQILHRAPHSQLSTETQASDHYWLAVPELIPAVHIKLQLTPGSFKFSLFISISHFFGRLIATWTPFASDPWCPYSSHRQSLQCQHVIFHTMLWAPCPPPYLPFLLSSSFPNSFMSSGGLILWSTPGGREIAFTFQVKMQPEGSASQQYS